MTMVVGIRRPQHFHCNLYSNNGAIALLCRNNAKNAVGTLQRFANFPSIDKSKRPSGSNII